MLFHLRLTEIILRRCLSTCIATCPSRWWQCPIRLQGHPIYRYLHANPPHVIRITRYPPPSSKCSATSTGWSERRRTRAPACMRSWPQTFFSRSGPQVRVIILRAALACGQFGAKEFPHVNIWIDSHCCVAQTNIRASH